MANRNPKQYVAAIVQNLNSWGGTEATVGAGNGTLLQTDGRNVSIEEQPIAETDTPFFETGDQVAHTADQSPRGFFRYDAGGLYTALALFMGTITNTTVTDAVSTAYEKILRPAQDIEGNYATYAIDKGAQRYSVPFFKPSGFTIAGESGNRPLNLTVPFLGSEELSDSSINTVGVFSSVTYDDRGNRIVYGALEFLMNDDSASTLSAASDKIKPVSFEIVAARNFDPFWTDSNRRDEPVDDSHPEFTVSMTFPRHAGVETGFLGDWRNETHKKLQITALGAVFASGGTLVREWRFRAPRFKFTDVNHGFDGFGRPTTQISGNCYDRTNFGGTPAGFASALPIELFFRHTRVTDY